MASDFQLDFQVFSGNESSDSSSYSSVIQSSPYPRNNISYNGSGFKGVLLQPNGYWGAMIYSGSDQRIWLGSFRLERDAAIAYDSASMKTRSWDMNRNILWNSFNIHEPNFQNNLSAETVIRMIKDGSYASKFLAYVKEQQSLMSPPKLFKKELTPSDVSRLNRLVIPKRFAVMHFCDSADYNNNAVAKEIVCYDRLNVEWKFRFNYWKSSQTFVFTRGWTAFMKEKKLKAKDTIVFYNRHPIETDPTFMIDIEVLEKESDMIQVKEEEDHVPDAIESTGSSSHGAVMLFGVRIG